MRTSSKKPRKQRYYEYNVSKHETHKLMSAPLSKTLQNEKGFRSLPVREGDSVIIVRGDYKGKSGKVNRTDPSRQRVYVEGIVNKKTDASEIGVPIHPSNLVITKYVTKKDRKRLELINRRIANESAKLDIESVLAEAEAEEEDLIEFDDDEFDDEEPLLDDEDLDDIDEEFEEETDVESDDDAEGEDLGEEVDEEEDEK
ncbi:MAG: 50S ribosomal protein L24 [Candidatus Kariarchaeaceae archaeon]|jgi:large subunit ribosomal protein L24